ncbi:MAG TPA: hypothetical protein VGX28_01440 [Frankiaceae bacterium]|jgi:hypothetical protein|nr:hypothetical protein [Frankiaceae bacterium]
MVKRITGTAALVCGLVVAIAGPAAAVQTVTISQCVKEGKGTAVITADSSACVGGIYDGAAIRW